jgi:hypothetical protein
MVKQTRDLVWGQKDKEWKRQQRCGTNTFFMDDDDDGFRGFLVDILSLLGNGFLLS